ncbi:sigma-70 family RNA polymerase sigma factor [Gelidibacter sp.]|uniref:RNA polymerase sigma factor n=1 Tax=Gelidibacter sp. TaxID=2018083 RepID=UPI002CDFA0FC|nr:sigma-70 family RNA polymerase sigma factor [Gelidibacter sp.]HUH27310.1 sigma-70 family RNA polymerase sigma factor [Gelidibacter sp.]
MENHLVDALKNNDQKLIKELYGRYRNEFFAFSKKYGIQENDRSDIYQEAFLGMRKHAISGKLYDVDCSFKTYLFGIAKHLIYDEHKYYASKKPYDAKLHNANSDHVIEIDSERELTQEQKLLRHYFNQLGKSCRQMLTLSFYRGLTNEEIAKQYGYESEAVVRSQKSRCLKTLKDLIKTSPK